MMDHRPRQFDLIVFDWDGTLFDSTALIVKSLQAACLDLQVPLPADRDAAYVIGMGLYEALAHLIPGLPPRQYEALIQRYRHHYFARQHELTLFEGVLPMLDAIKARHHWVAIATGKSRRGLNEALDTVQLRGVFDSTRTADDTLPKPHPRMLQELMGEFGVDPERTLMIGDTTHDLQMALNADAASLAVSYGAHEPAFFKDYQPRFVAHSVAELHQWLQEHA
ncbi:HAD family hydrolase [Eleftheria terrae]|uniref:HAD family hydrolase n=1 Tax=Eleftheria terrae TaxID=1597781 RepID=UPI00263AF739|nr:HAD-IA family hydrolase [Eleftheria terrae]WKB54575.1 HAD-IA family hydrolase [Eleftheria terrae]